MTQTTDTIALRDFLRRIAPLTGTDLRDAFANEVIETGGTYPTPTDFDQGCILFELNLHGQYMRGIGEDVVIEHWIKEARAAVHHSPAIRATDGRPDCPYNGQGVA